MPIITTKSSSENFSNHNKHKHTFTNTFVFKTKRELKCQNELFFFNIIRSVFFDYWEFLTNFLTYLLRTIIWRRTKLQLFSTDFTFLQGDSGGPLVCPDSNGIGKLAGIVSFGMTACNAMSGFTRVSYYQDWILARLEQ